MASRKRARTSSASGSPSSETAVTTVELSGGWALSPELVQLWRSGRLTDTVVEVDGRSFAAHRLVLASACDYFNRHYDNEHMRDSDHPKLLEHVTAAAFEPLLAFLYEGTCTFDESLLAPVLRAANYLNVAPLERAAVEALKDRLSPSNALTAWTWGEELELPELAEAAKEAALRGFDEVEKIEEATLAQVQALVADDRLTAKSEELVFSAVARFAEAKQPAEADLHALLRNVRFPLMNEAFLLSAVRNWPLLDTMAGKNLLLTMLAPFLSGPAQQPRRGFCPRTLYVIGGDEDGAGGREEAYLSSIEIYDPQAASWKLGVPMPKACSYASAEVLDGKIYVLGGCEEEQTNVVHVFDPLAGTWAEAAPLITPRSKHASAVAGGKLYVLGGYDADQDEQLASVEVFDPQTGEWAEAAPMSLARDQFAAAVLDGKIYAVGGLAPIDGPMDTVEVYDPATNTWAAAPPMGTPRHLHGVAALGGKIYVAGGEANHHDFVNSVEEFDPQTQSWADVAPMSSSRAYVSLTAVQGRLYAVGGSTGVGGRTATAEAYDPQQNRWMSIASISTRRATHAAVAV